jgi:hypothetical protein
MAIEMQYRVVPGLPKLAWIAAVDLQDRHLTVYHGHAVECREEWMVEGVWDGPFAEGNFHRSEHFFGSGLRLEEDTLYFVASSALVDRLVYCVDGRTLLVSNSFVLLLAYTGAQLDRGHQYIPDCMAILKGIRDYHPEMPVLHPTITHICQLFHGNLVVQDGDISTQCRTLLHPLHSFTQYVTLLKGVLQRLKANYESSARTRQMVAYTTCSSGYDSTAVSCLVRELGVKTCFTRRRSNSAIPPWVSRRSAIDSGQATAQRLGYATMLLDSHAMAEDELYFLAPGTWHPEIVFYSFATTIESMEQLAVLFTGYHGDKVWDANLEEKYHNDQIKRGDASGLNLSEIRLKSGFINVAIPFVFSRSVEDIVRISRSPEMEPWRLHNDYDRPIPRRIAESAGIPRRSFGMRKKAVIWHYEWPFNRQLRRQFLAFLKEHYGISAFAVYAQRIINRGIYLPRRACAYLSYCLQTRTLTLAPDPNKVIQPPEKVFWKHVYLPCLLFLWAAEELSRRMAPIISAVSKPTVTNGVSLLQTKLGD